MKVYVLFDYTDFMGVFATYQAAQRAIPDDGRSQGYTISAYEVQT